MSKNSSADDATYSLVDRNGELWPVVHCTDDMIPADELEIRPAGYYRAVLLLAIFEFKWVLNSDIFEFDPSASQRIPEGPHKVQLKAAFDSVLGSPSLPGHSPYPDLGFWRSELLARDLENISSGSDSAPTVRTPARNENVTTPSSSEVKRPWSKFKLEKDFGNATKKPKTEHKKNPGPWFPDEDDGDEVNAPPPRGYFEKLKKEHDQVQKLRDLAILDTSSEASSESSSSTDDESEGASDSESSDEEEVKPIQPLQPKVKKETKRDASTSPSSRTLSTRSSTAPKQTATKPSAGRLRTDRKLQEITQLCKQLDTARSESRWDDASAAATQLLANTHWSDSGTLLIARAAFRAAPRPDVEDGFEHGLRAAVARQVALNYERLRASNNSMLAIVLRDHRELAEMVYERRLQALRRREIEVVEIESD